MNKRPLACLGLAVSAVLMFSGCSKDAVAAEAPKPKTTVETSTPEVKLTGYVLPTSCAEANPELAAFNAEAFQNGRTGVEGGEVETELVEYLTGPIAAQTFEKRTGGFSCGYPMHMEGGSSQHFILVPQADQQELINALRADPEVSEETIGGGSSDMSTFTWRQTLGPDEEVDIVEISYGFVDDIWVASYGFRSGAQKYLASAKQAMDERAAVPAQG